MDNVILIQVKVQSIKKKSPTYRAQNRFRGDAIRLVSVYVLNVIYDEILETIFLREELHYDELILVGEVESTDDESKCN